MGEAKHEKDTSVRYSTIKDAVVGCVCGWRFYPPTDHHISFGSYVPVMDAVLEHHIAESENPDTTSLAEMAIQPRNKMTNYTITCKECSWTYTTDKIGEVSYVVARHKDLHCMAHLVTFSKQKCFGFEGKERGKNISKKLGVLFAKVQEAW